MRELDEIKEELLNMIVNTELVQVWSWDCGCVMSEGKVHRRCVPQGPFTCRTQNGKALISLLPKEMVDVNPGV